MPSPFTSPPSFSSALTGLSDRLWNSQDSAQPEAGLSGENLFSIPEGGALPGLSSGPREGIVSLCHTDFGSAFCGGVVGKSGHKMCVRASCSVGAHASNKAERAFLFNPDGDNPEAVADMVFIVAQRDAAGQPATVHLLPRLPRNRFPPSKFQEATSSRKTIDTWDVVFKALLGTQEPFDSMDEEDQEEGGFIVDKIMGSESIENYTVTPQKRKRSSLEESDAESANVRLVPVPRVSEDDQTPLACVVQQGLDALSENLKTVLALVRHMQEGLSSRVMEVDDDVGELDVKVAKLKSLLGDRDEDLGTASAFDILAKVMGSDGALESGSAGSVTPVQLSTLQDQVNRIIAWKSTCPDDFDKAANSIVEQAIKLHVFSGDYHTHFIGPLLSLLTKTSSKAETPGDLLFERLAKIEKRLDEGLAGVTAPSAGGALVPPQRSSLLSGIPDPWGSSRLGGGATSNHIPANSSGSTLTTVGGGPVTRSELEALKVQYQNLQGQMEATAVEVGGIMFRSLEGTTAWFLANSRWEHICHFLDPLSLLSLSDFIYVDYAAATKSRESTAKLKDPSSEYTQYRSSFGNEVPPILGKSADPNTTPSDRCLPACPRYQDWDSGVGRDGIKTRLESLLKDGESRCRAVIKSTLGGDAYHVAGCLLSAAKEFWTAFITWIGKYYTELRNRSSASEKECWVLVTHCVRIVFTEFRKVRNVGQSGDPGQMLWGTLQAYHVAEELVKLEFQGHPKVSAILHQHLIDHSVPMSHFKVLEEKVKQLTTALNDTKKNANKALTQAEKALAKT